MSKSTEVTNEDLNKRPSLRVLGFFSLVTLATGSTVMALEGAVFRLSQRPAVQQLGLELMLIGAPLAVACGIRAYKMMTNEQNPIP